MVNHPNRGKKDEFAILVTTSHRGVFFGYSADYLGKTIELRAARNCVSWGTDQKGFLGLANMGPTKSARVGPAADIVLHDVTCVAKCTDAAAAAWELAPWTR